MSSEHDHSLIATIADYLLAVILLIVGGISTWIFNHEQRVTRLEAQGEECMRARERNEEALHEVRVELKHMSSKLDRILGFCGARHEDGQ